MALWCGGASGCLCRLLSFHAAVIFLKLNGEIELESLPGSPEGFWHMGKGAAVLEGKNEWLVQLGSDACPESASLQRHAAGARASCRAAGTG